MHANFASILGSIFERFGVHFGFENGGKMATKFNVFWHCFLIPFFDVSGLCLLVFLNFFSHHAKMSFLVKKALCFLYCCEVAFCMIN